MKKLGYIAAVVLLAACGSNNGGTDENVEAVDSTNVAAEAPVTGSFGAEISEAGALAVPDFLAQMTASGSYNGKITTTINECCQKKGCWMMVDIGDGKEMRVTFKDYEFFVPFGCAGYNVVMEGKAYYDTTSVDDLRHYAEDAGKTAEEIAAITEPEIALGFEAVGVIIK